MTDFFRSIERETDEYSKVRCEGECNKHIGEVRRVNVSHPNHDWGEFNYCETAIAEDKSRGLKVTTVSEAK